jgi:hypothetical protein
VATIKAELGTASLPRIFLDFMEQVLPVAKAIEDNPWTDIGRYDQLDDPIGQLVRIVPASVRESLEHCREICLSPQTSSFAFF